MIDYEEIQKNIQKIYDGNNNLNTLMDFENIIDSLHLYSYDNWAEGEVIKGPDVSRYWINVTLMYPYKQMPDPEGALRLTNYGCKVAFKISKFLESVDINTPDDLEIEPITGKRKPKKKVNKVWLVHISMPRHFIDDFNSNRIRVNGVEINMTDISKAKDENIDTISKQTDTNNNDFE